MITDPNARMELMVSGRPSFLLWDKRGGNNAYRSSQPCSITQKPIEPYHGAMSKTLSRNSTRFWCSTTPSGFEALKHRGGLDVTTVAIRLSVRVGVQDLDSFFINVCGLPPLAMQLATYNAFSTLHSDSQLTFLSIYILSSSLHQRSYN
jgi:hypothetical protein